MNIEPLTTTFERLHLLSTDDLDYLTRHAVIHRDVCAEHGFEGQEYFWVAILEVLADERQRRRDQAGDLEAMLHGDRTDVPAGWTADRQID